MKIILWMGATTTKRTVFKGLPIRKVENHRPREWGVIHNCDPCIWKEDLGHAWLHREFKVSPGYVRAFLKTDGWREGSAVESMCCLQRTGVLFPAPNDSSQPAPGDLTPLASVQAPAFTCTRTHARTHKHT